jgi:hypothetical protein
MMHGNETLISTVVDWQSQRGDFEPDGSLRDIYVQNATIEDWKLVISRVLEFDRRARIQNCGVDIAMPANIESLFDHDQTYLLSFSVGLVGLTCHFFTPTEIEFSFAPEAVSEVTLADVLGFMIDVGDATRKTVIMTPENGRHLPIFEYNATSRQLRWLPPRYG